MAGSGGENGRQWRREWQAVAARSVGEGRTDEEEDTTAARSVEWGPALSGGHGAICVPVRKYEP
jgi:hypothetical protein